MKHYCFILLLFSFCIGNLCAQVYVPDSSFGANSILPVNFYYADGIAQQIGIQSTGKVIVEIWSPSKFPSLYLQRINEDGSPDNTFGTDGKVILYDGDLYVYFATALFYSDLYIDSEDKIILCGRRVTGLGPGHIYYEAVRYDSEGTLDTTFAEDGFADINFGNLDFDFNTSALQEDGKILLAGSASDTSQDNYDGLILRLDTSGIIDSSFISGSYLKFNLINDNDDINHLAQQSDGKLLIMGGANGNGNLIYRCSQSGVTDYGYGFLGRLKIDSLFPNFGYGNAFLLEPDDKVIVAGKGGGNGLYDTVSIARINEDGSIDSSFGHNGISYYVTDVLLKRIEDIQLTPNGKILTRLSVENSANTFLLLDSNGLIDSTFGNNGILDPELNEIDSSILSLFDTFDDMCILDTSHFFIGGRRIIQGRRDAAVVKYDYHAMLDSSFGNSNGIVDIPVGRSLDHIGTICFDSDSHCLLSGSGNTFDAGNIYALAEVDQNGNTISNFGNDSGKVVGYNPTYLTETFYSAATFDEDGRIVAGSSQWALNYADNDSFLLARYLADGSLDSSFGTNGKFIGKQFSQVNNVHDHLNTLTIKPDNKIVLSFYTDNGSSIGLGIVQLTESGKYDSTFSSDGLLTLDLSSGYEYYPQLCAQQDGKILIIGSDIYGFRLIRLNGDGSYDTSFGANGNGIIYITMSLYSGLLLSDGKILVMAVGSNNTLTIYRFNSNGIIDITFGNNGTLSWPIDFDGYGANLLRMFEMPDGKVVVIGYCWIDEETKYIVEKRFTPNGEFESSYGNNGSYNFWALWNEAWNIDGFNISPDGSIWAYGSLNFFENGDAFVMKLDPSIALVNNELVTPNKSNLSVFPNPSDNEIHLALTCDTREFFETQICDQSGKVLINQKIDSDYPILNVSLLPPGFYYIKTRINDQSQVAKFVKQ